MTLLLKALIAGITILGLSEVIESQMFKYNTTILPPIDTVSIIMASYNEENTIIQSLKSITDQSIIKKYPDQFELILVDSNSTDNTVQLASQFSRFSHPDYHKPIDKMIISPKGKLTSRRIGIDNAENNIIVSVDADTIYPYHWLNTLLTPYRYPSLPSLPSLSKPIIATVGNTYDYSIPRVPGPVHTLIYTLDRSLLHKKQLPGRNSSFKKKYFYESGGFNENINQLDIGQMYWEEEIYFGNRLSKLGRIIFQNNATCIHLGGVKIAHRLGLFNRDMNKYKFGIDRF